jgi:hypothetical protein
MVQQTYFLCAHINMFFLCVHEDVAHISNHDDDKYVMCIHRKFPVLTHGLSIYTGEKKVAAAAAKS